MIMPAVLTFVFFFSSRRRHTRSLCDWSSDVCSSDLSRLTDSKLVDVLIGWTLVLALNDKAVVGNRASMILDLVETNSGVSAHDQVATGNESHRRKRRCVLGNGSSHRKPIAKIDRCRKPQ